MVMVGDLDRSTLYYLVISSSVKYQFENFMDCFDACFKIFFALDLDYPLFGYRFWLYVQREIFKIKLNNDKAFQLSGLISLLVNHIPKSDDETSSSVAAQNSI
jgi:hypothetical protein